MYPITLKLAGKPVVVVGGGKVAYAKLQALLQADADITVVSPEFLPEIEQLHEEGKLKLLRKAVAPEDYEAAFFIIAATDAPEINRQIYESVGDTKLVNVASDSESGNVHLPATLKRGKLQISVATGGASPMLAAHIRNELQDMYDASYEQYVDFLYTVKMSLKQSALPTEEKRALLRRCLDAKYRNSSAERERLLASLRQQK